MANPKADEYWKRVAEHVAKLPQAERDSMPAIHVSPPDPKLDAWYWYFSHHLGWVPAALQSLIEGRTKGFTVPAEWPEWFDLAYAPPSSIPAAPRYRPPDRHGRADLVALRERVRQIWKDRPEDERSGQDYKSMFEQYGRPIGRFETALPQREKK